MPVDGIRLEGDRDSVPKTIEAKRFIGWLHGPTSHTVVMSKYRDCLGVVISPLEDCSAARHAKLPNEATSIY